MMKRLPLPLVLLFFTTCLCRFSDAVAQTQVNDLGITFFNPPQSGCFPTTATSQNITVTIHNYGNVSQTMIPIIFSINNVDFTQTWTGILTAGTSSQFTSTQTLYLSAPGTYMIVARLSPDSNPSNDADTIYITNSNMLPGNVSLNFNLPHNGTDVLRKVTNVNSAITQSGAANHGPTGTGGMIMDGIDSPNWVTPGGSTTPWTSNPDHFAATYFCFNPDSGKVNDTLRISFDLKQLYKTSHNNTNFRVTVNGQQVGPTYNPPVGGYGGGSAPWNRIEIDFSSFLGSPTLEIGLESSVKEAYANGNGTANLIDNLEVERIPARLAGTGIKENFLQNKIVIFPNPSNGLFNLKIPASTRNYSVEVTDLTGKVVKQQLVKNNSGAEQLNLNGTAKGIYILKIASEGNIATHKLVVE